MKEAGVVIKNSGKFATVRIGRNSACGSCGKCGMTENSKHVDFYVENTLNAETGDTVEVEIPDANAAGLAFVAYIIPLIPALALMFLSILMKWAEWLSVVLFFAGFAAGFAAVVLLDRKKKHKWTNSPVLTAVLRKAASDDSPTVLKSEKENKDE